MGVVFSEQQARTIAAAITTVAALVILLTIGVLGWLAALFLQAFSGVFLPLAVGAIAALVCRPYYEWLHERMRLPMAVAMLAVFLSVLLPLTAFALFFGGILVRQLVGLTAYLPEWWESLRLWVMHRVPEVSDLIESSGAGERLRSVAKSQWSKILQGLQSVGFQAISAGVGLARGVVALLGWLVVPVYFAYFLTARRVHVDGDRLLPFLKPETRRDAMYLGQEFVDISVAFFRGQMVIAFLQGLMFAAGFSLVGLRYGFVIGLLLGLLNVIPYLGNIVGLAIALPLALLHEGGGPGPAAMVLAVFVVVQQIEGWVLTPKIMGDRTGLHFMAIIVAIFFWGTALGGILGMILAIPLTAFLASMWHLAREKYIPEIL